VDPFFAIKTMAAKSGDMCGISHPRTITLTKRALYILENTQLPFPMSANAVRLARFI